MAFASFNHLAAGTKVKVSEPMPVPEWSKWDDDKGRVSTPVKKRLQGMFFQGNRKVVAEVIYISKPSEREQLRRKGMVKIRARDASGTAVVFSAESSALAKTR